LWFRTEGLTFPLQMHQGGEIRWVDASYTAVHHALTNPVYAGAYTYGKTRQETTLDTAGVRRKRIRHLPRSQWQVLIPEHHPGFIEQSHLYGLSGRATPRPLSPHPSERSLDLYGWTVVGIPMGAGQRLPGVRHRARQGR